MLDLSKEMLKYEKQKMISFHTPGHKGKAEFFEGLHFPHQDLTELPGLDMLHTPLGVIGQAQQRASEIYQSDGCFYLINGATVGNQGMFMALACNREQENQQAQAKVLIERQSHRSVMSALVLTGLEPEYIPSVVHPEFGLPLGLKTIEDIDLSNYLGVHLTYPTYYGTLFDLKKIVAQRDHDFPQVSILVDQAHGSHYLNKLFPKGALDLGADLVLHSTHKTLSALTQGAMLHIKGKRVSYSELKKALELLQSSSPSYLVMASLERAVEYALETSRWEQLYEGVQELKHLVGKFLRVLDRQDIGNYGITGLDWSKILVNTKPLGISASICVDYLRRQYGIEPELWDEENILFVLGIGNTLEEVKVLTKGLLSLKDLKIEKIMAEQDFGAEMELKEKSLFMAEIPLPPRRLTPRQAYFAKKRKIPLADSLGKIAGESISPYPPGIPLVVMGEEITAEILEILTLDKGRWQGWEDIGQGVWVIEED